MKLFDRLVAHVTDVVLDRIATREREARIRAKANRPLTFGNTEVHNINVSSVEELERQMKHRAAGRSA